MAQVAMDGFQNIKTYLLSKQREVINKIRRLDEEESSLNDVAPESQEPGTSSWEADTQSTRAAIKKQLLIFAHSLQATLLKLQKGTYGICDRCKRHIDKARLEIIPTATLCIGCVN